MKDRRKSSRTSGRKAGGAAGREGRFLNLKGEVSSYALIRCLMQLEELPAGGLLKVLLSDEHVAADLGKFLTDEGHKVVEVDRAGPGVWRMDIEKGKQ